MPQKRTHVGSNFTWKSPGHLPCTDGGAACRTRGEDKVRMRRGGGGRKELKVSRNTRVNGWMVIHILKHGGSGG